MRINNHIDIDENELNWQFTKASGPGGQHVNTTDSAVKLRFNINNSQSISNRIKSRLRHLYGNRINKSGELILEASDHRSRERNRNAARERFRAIIREADRQPVRRRPTRPPKSSVEERLMRKKKRSQKKQNRRPPDRSND
jgi:ribosome-associated protein